MNPAEITKFGARDNFGTQYSIEPRFNIAFRDISQRELTSLLKVLRKNPSWYGKDSSKGWFPSLWRAFKKAEGGLILACVIIGFVAAWYPLTHFWKAKNTGNKAKIAVIDVAKQGLNKELN